MREAVAGLMFSAESVSHNWGRFGKRSGYLACCCEVLQPNWGPLVASKEPLILWGLFLPCEVFVVVGGWVGLCLVSPCL